MFCKHCGKEVNDQAIMCVHCGCSLQKTPGAELDASPKSKITAILLCVFLGGLGVHRFYVGKIGTGILMFFTIGLFGILTFIDLIRLVCGTFTDGDGRKIVN